MFIISGNDWCTLVKGGLIKTCRMILIVLCLAGLNNVKLVLDWTPQLNSMLSPMFMLCTCVLYFTFPSCVINSKGGIHAGLFINKW